MRRFIFLLLLFLLIFVVSIKVYENIKQKDFYETSFQGNIESIQYDGKSQPTVKVKSNLYKFPFGGEKNELQIGDSLVKKKNGLLVYQFRKGVLIAEYEW